VLGVLSSSLRAALRSAAVIRFMETAIFRSHLSSNRTGASAPFRVSALDAKLGRVCIYLAEAKSMSATARDFAVCARHSNMVVV
jgi:hypothetical protein